MILERIPEGFVRGLVRDPDKFEPFFLFDGNDRTAEIFPEFHASLEADFAAEVMTPIPPESECPDDDSDDESPKGGKKCGRRRD